MPAPWTITITLPTDADLAAVCNSIASGQPIAPATAKAAIVAWLQASVVQSKQAAAQAAALAAVGVQAPPTVI